MSSKVVEVTKRASRRVRVAESAPNGSKQGCATEVSTRRQASSGTSTAMPAQLAPSASRHGRTCA